MSSGVRQIAWVVAALSSAGLAGAEEPKTGADGSEVGARASLVVAVDASADSEFERAIAHGQEDDEKEDGDDEADVAEGSAAGGAGVRGSFGRAFSEGLADSWYGRFEMEAFTAKSRYGAGPLGGAMIGGELWTGPDGGGGGLPMTLFLALRSPTLITSLGGGFQVFIYDRVNDDAGFGLYAPQGVFSLGLDFGGLRVLGEARAIYRWQWGAPDRGQITVGLTVSQIEERLLSGRRPQRPPADASR